MSKVPNMQYGVMYTYVNLKIIIRSLFQGDILFRVSSQESKRSLYNTCRGEVVSVVYSGT